MFTLKQRVQPNKEEVAAKVMDGEAILINLSNGVYYSMDKVGAAIWELIETGCSFEEMVAALSERYQVSAEQAQTDLERLVGELLDEKLFLDSTDGPLPKAERPWRIDTKEPYEQPQLNIYRDMGDLLALDPPTPGLDASPWKGPEEDNKI
jgi:hypothetical protein